MSGINRLENRLFVRLAGQHKSEATRIPLFYFLQKLRAAHHRHSHVRNHHVKGLIGHRPQSLFASGHKRHLPFRTHRVETTLQAGQHHRIVVDENYSFRHSWTFVAVGS
jgi:hypothetical protein